MQYPTVHPPSHCRARAALAGPLAAAAPDGWVHVAPLLAVLLFLAIILAVFWYLRIEEASREQEALKRDVEYAQQRLRLRLLERQEQLMRMARDISNREVLPPQFNSRAESLISQYPELQSITWIDVRRRVTALETRPSVQPQPRWMEQAAARRGGRERLRPGARPAPAGVRCRRWPRMPSPRCSCTCRSRPGSSPASCWEYSVDSLLRYGVPSEVLAKYAVALLDDRATC
jgi:hypothetical protein